MHSLYRSDRVHWAHENEPLIRDARAAAPRVTPIVGLDLGQVSDPSALAFINRTIADGKAGPMFECSYLHRWKTGIPYPKIVEDVVKVFETPAFAGKEKPILAIDATGVGRPVADMFRDTKIEAKFVPVVITGGHGIAVEGGTYHVPKRLLVSNMQVALQNKRFKFAGELPEAATLISEMQNFQLTITEAMNDTYAGRSGTHDDLLLSVAIGVWAGYHFSQGEPRMVPSVSHSVFG